MLYNFFKISGGGWTTNNGRADDEPETAASNSQWNFTRTCDASVQTDLDDNNGDKFNLSYFNWPSLEEKKTFTN